MGAQQGVWTNRLENLLVGQDKFFAGPGAGPDYDWPNPKIPAYPLSNRTHLAPLNLRLLGQDTFFSGPGCGPDYSWPVPVPPRRQAFPLPQNVLLTTTLAPITTAPFFQTDWPLPRQPARLYQSWQINLQESTLFPIVAQAPFNQTDWPLPRVAAYGIGLRSHLDTLKLNLQSQDVLPFNQGDWPLPRRSPLPLPDQTWIQTSLNTVLTPVVTQALPFNQYDWPIQQRQPFRFATHRRPDVYPLAPFVQTDWPIPKTPYYSTSLRTHLSLLKYNLQGQDAFPVGGPDYDWPNPKTPFFGPHLRTHLQSTPLNLQSLDAFPFRQMDWPLAPRLKPTIFQSWQINLLQTTIKPQDVLPFNQYHWPLAKSPPVYRPTGPVPNYALLFPPKPFTQADWPLPTRPRYGVQLRSLTGALNLNLPPPPQQLVIIATYPNVACITILELKDPPP